MMIMKNLLLLATLPLAAAFAPVPTTQPLATKSSALAASSKTDIDGAGLAKAAGYLAAAAASVALIVAPSLVEFPSVSLPSAPPSTKVAATPKPAKTTATPKATKVSSTVDTKALFEAKRAALAAKQASEQAAADARMAQVKATKASVAKATKGGDEVPAYDGLLTKATEAAPVVTKTATETPATPKEAKAAAAPLPDGASFEASLKEELKTMAK